MRIGIKAKLFLGFGAMLFLIVLIGTISVMNANRVSQQMENLYQNNTMAAVQLANAESSLWQLRYGFPQFMVLTHPQDRMKILADQEKWYEIIDNNLRMYAAGDKTPEEKQALKELGEILAKYIQARPRWFELYQAGKIEEAAEYRARTTTPYGAATVKAFDKLIKLQQKVGEERHRKVLTQEAAFRKLLICIVVLAAVVAALIVKKTAQPLLKGVAFAQSIAAGDLTQTLVLENKDELGDLSTALNSMVTSLKEMIGMVNRTLGELVQISSNLAQASGHVVDAAKLQADGVKNTSSAVGNINASIKGVAAGVGGLSDSTAKSNSSILEMSQIIEEVSSNVAVLSQSVGEVTSSIVEMAASVREIDKSVQNLMKASDSTFHSVEQMDVSIKLVEENSKKTAGISMEVRKDAETGKEAVEAAIAGIKEIKRSSLITSEVISTLSAKTLDIGGILSVIDEVAGQTNLLALNAAIIAAQAGEHGKGFSVVAEEIKDLATRTHSSTREIADVIKGVQDETRRAVEAIKQAEISISAGEQLSYKAGEALEKIVNGVEKTSEQMAEIARTTVEQSNGSQMIRKAMEQVSSMVGQIVSATSEQSKGSEQIMGAVESMSKLTSQVCISTNKLTEIGEVITISNEEINSMIRQIQLWCADQTSEGDQIVQAVQIIERSTDTNIESTLIMNDAVAGLTAQIKVLQQETSGYRVNA